MLELDVLVEGMSDHVYQGIVFEINNRDDINPTTEKEIQQFVQKIELFTYALKRQGHEHIMLCPIYFSANGFELDTENWLYEHHLLTADMDSWEINKNIGDPM